MPKIIKPQSLGAKEPVTENSSYEERKEAFIKEVDKIGDAYKIGITPKVSVSNDGILPALVFIDRKPKPQAPVSDSKTTKQ